MATLFPQTIPHRLGHVFVFVEHGNKYAVSLRAEGKERQRGWSGDS